MKRASDRYRVTGQRAVIFAQDDQVAIDASSGAHPDTPPARRRLRSRLGPDHGLRSAAGYAAQRDQWDISTGTVIDSRIVRVAPPSAHSFSREWP